MRRKKTPQDVKNHVEMNVAKHRRSAYIQGRIGASSIGGRVSTKILPKFSRLPESLDTL